MGERVAILGPGLLGGSLAMALVAQQRDVVVWGRRQQPLDHLKSVCHGVTVESDLDHAVADASLVVLATPIGVMPGLLRSIRQSASSGKLITDVGSVKAPIVAHAETILEGSSHLFVGSHPMAGSEASGIEAATAGLFDGARCLVTPHERSPADAIEKIAAFWKSVAMRVHQLSAEEHDRIVAHISHLPHALASLLVTTAIGDHPEWAAFCGGGLQDTTRVASGEPHMWTEIFLENRKAVLESLNAAESELRRLASIIESEEIEALNRFLLEAKELRDSHIVPQIQP